MDLRIASGVLAIVASTSAFGADPIQLAVDARDVSRQIVHVTETIPAAPGAMTLALPRWLPGYHGPEGKVVNLVDLHINAGDSAKSNISWLRDAVELDQFHLTVPKSTSSISVTFDFLLKDDDVSREVAVIEWNNVVLYPIPSKMTDLELVPSITLPKGWEYATALHATGDSTKSDGKAAFSQVSLMTLIDSPLFSGRFHKSYDVGPVNNVPHHIEVFADSAKSTEMSDKVLAAQKRLPIEAFALFGAQHYSQYTWLVALSSDLYAGIEHHESSDNRMKETALTDEALGPGFNNLLSHEFVHSWNGKHRRPAGLVTDDFQEPEKTDLLWVYEGLTEYWGVVLSARCGAWTPDGFRQTIADYADDMDHQTGRDWRSIHDVATDASQIYDPPKGNGARRRRAGDFYSEGTLIWLDADVKIRNLTDGKKSLDDFAKRFYGGPGGKPSVESYTFDDVVAALNEVAPFDWAGFLHDRVDKLTATSPRGGIVDGGYTLDYTDTQSDWDKQIETADSRLNFAASIGLNVSTDDGSIGDVIPGSPADKAGVPVGAKIIGVDGLKYTGDRLKDAVAATKQTPVELIVEQREKMLSFKLDYSGGPRYPTLKRDEAKPDRIAEIIKPLATKPDEDDAKSKPKKKKN